MRIFYSRVSSTDNSQRHDRQLQNLKDFDYVLTDNCSGSIPLFERPKGKQIKKMIDDGTKIDLVLLDYIDCVVPESSSKDEWKAEGSVMRGFEAMCHELSLKMVLLINLVN